MQSEFSIVDKHTNISVIFLIDDHYNNINR